MSVEAVGGLLIVAGFIIPAVVIWCDCAKKKPGAGTPGENETTSKKFIQEEV